MRHRASVIDTQIPVGRTRLELPLVNPNIARLTVTSPSGHTVSVVPAKGSPFPFSASLAADIPQCVEVIEGDLEGDRFEVDVAATQSSPQGTLVLLPNSPLNSFPLDQLGRTLIGQTLALRPHITLSQLQSLFHPPLTGHTSPAKADQITLADPDGSSLRTYYLTPDSKTWRLLGSRTPEEPLTVIPPEQASSSPNTTPPPPSSKPEISASPTSQSAAPKVFTSPAPPSQPPHPISPKINLCTKTKKMLHNLRSPV